MSGVCAWELTPTLTPTRRHLPLKGGFHSRCGVSLHVRQEVRVDVQSDANLAVTKHFGDQVRRNLLAQETVPRWVTALLGLARR